MSEGEEKEMLLQCLDVLLDTASALPAQVYRLNAKQVVVQPRDTILVDEPQRFTAVPPLVRWADRTSPRWLVWRTSRATRAFGLLCWTECDGEDEEDCRSRIEGLLSSICDQC